MPDKQIEILMTITQTETHLSPMCPDHSLPMYKDKDGYQCSESGCRMTSAQFDEIMGKAGKWMADQGYGVKA